MKVGSVKIMTIMQKHDGHFIRINNGVVCNTPRHYFFNSTKIVTVLSGRSFLFLDRCGKPFPHRQDPQPAN